MFKNYYLKTTLWTIIFFIYSFSLYAQCPQLVWSDEFDGNSLDLTKWEIQTGDGCQMNLCNWGNNELQYYQGENATVSDGTLKITAKRENVGGKSYTSARIRSRNKGDWTYGRFEARIKLPFGQGMWPAFWMLSTNEPYGEWPQSGEIDIMELVGHEPEVVHGTVHYGNPWPQNQFTGESFSLPSGIFNDDFYVFAVEWEQNEIRWYVDDYMYSSKTRGDLSGFRWPFDHDFHFLLNLAVGGTWPGNPNSSTPFPQTMEVDYVRVYDGNFAHLRGNNDVENRAIQERYTVLNAPEGATYSWEIPDGAVITAGEGTASILVDWGDNSGEIKVDIETLCETKSLSVYVAVKGPFLPDFYFMNFDDDDQLVYTYSDGIFNKDVANPSASGINTSPLVGRYQRKSDARYDVLVFETRSPGGQSSMPNANEYVEGKRRFYMDVYTDATVGTQVLLQLENSSVAAPENFPSGRHSRYSARTTVQNQWERLQFELLDQPDDGVLGGSVDELIVLFAPDRTVEGLYYFDNFASYTESEVTSVDGIQIPDLRIYPNPSTDILSIELPQASGQATYTLRNIAGKIVREGDLRGNVHINLIDLPKGIYMISLDYLDKVIHSKIIKQ